MTSCGFRHKHSGWAAAAVAALATAFVPCAASAKAPIEVGMAVALTGYLATFDGQIVDGVKLMVAKANTDGGIDGQKIDLHVLDDASSATTGVTVTNQMLNQFNVGVMINGLSSAQNAAIEPILARAKVPQLDGSVLPPNPQWAFEINILNERADALEVDYAAKRLHAKTVALVYSQTPYGQNAAKGMRARAEKLGMRVVYAQAIEPSATDMTPQMAALKATSPDAVLDKLTGSTHIVEGKGAATVGLGLPIVMAQDDVPTVEKVVAAYPDAVFIATNAIAYPDVANAAAKKACAAFITAYTKAGHDPAGLAGASAGWDGVRILAKAIEIAGTTTGDKLRAALERTTVQGCSTLYRYSASDHYGQMTVPNEIEIARMKGDKVEVIYRERELKLAE
jgi:branched-chain amino acid transport system substrate-binding protein